MSQSMNVICTFKQLKMFALTLAIWTLLLVLLIYLIFSVTRNFLIMRNVCKLPGPPNKNWLKGNVSALYDAPENWFKVLRKWGLEYFPIYQNNAALVAAANILDPCDFETILSSSKHIEKSRIYNMMHEWLGTGLLTSGGQKWHNRRKILTPSFHFNVLQEFIGIFTEETRKLISVLRKECANSYVIDVKNHIGEFTLNTIGETAMGMNFGTATLDGQQYKTSIQQISEIYNYRLIRPLLMNKFLYLFDPNCYKEKKLVKTMHKFTNCIIKGREKSFQSNFYSKSKRLAMLDLLLTTKKEENSINDEGIREEVDTFMFEGHDTTSAAICFALMLIACHPEVQARITKEIKEVFYNVSKIDYKTLQKLKYLEMCIKETLRLYPSVPFIARILGEDMVTHSGYHLKAGSMVHLHIYDLHHNPQIYPEPEKFDPERFLPENCQNRHNFAFVPFSAGQRNCIGQKFAILELKTVLSGILSEFSLEPIDTTSSIVLKSEVVLRTKNGIRVKFVPRIKRIINFDCL